MNVPAASCLQDHGDRVGVAVRVLAFILISAAARRSDEAASAEEAARARSRIWGSKEQEIGREPPDSGKGSGERIEFDYANPRQMQAERGSSVGVMYQEALPRDRRLGDDARQWI